MPGLALPLRGAGCPRMTPGHQPRVPPHPVLFLSYCTGVRIRQFTLDDYNAAAALWELSEGMSAPGRQEVERKLERDPQLFLVAEDDSSPPAMLGVVIGSYDGRRGWVFRLAVAPDHRRRGIGSALVSELERRFVEMGVDRIRVLTVRDNVPACEFWEELGYSGFDQVVLFSKDLARQATSP
jgi:ribosomal protein S18 acetylase RimI-like enzyme